MKTILALIVMSLTLAGGCNPKGWPTTYNCDKFKRYPLLYTIEQQQWAERHCVVDERTGEWSYRP